MPIIRAISSCRIPQAASDLTRRRCSSVGLIFGRGILRLLRGRHSLRCYFIESTAVGGKHRCLSGDRLPASYDDVNVPRLDIEAIANPLRGLAIKVVPEPRKGS